jgi:type IV secretory pathway VirB10-like protein
MIEALEGERGPVKAPRLGLRRGLLLGGAALALVFAVGWLASGGDEPGPAPDARAFAPPPQPDFNRMRDPEPEPPPVQPVAFVAPPPPPPSTPPVFMTELRDVGPPPPPPPSPPPAIGRTSGGAPAAPDWRKRKMESGLSILGADKARGPTRREDTRLANALVTSDLKASEAWVVEDPSWTIGPGTIFTVKMMTVVVSDVPGLAVGMLAQPIRAMDGRVLFNPGAKVLFEANSRMSFGEERLLLTATYVGDGTLFCDAGSPAGGPLGQPGVEGYVDNQYVKRFAAAITLAMLRDLGSSADTGGIGNSQVAQSATSGVADEIARGVDVRPRLTTQAGTIVTVTVSRFLMVQAAQQAQAFP